VLAHQLFVKIIVSLLNNYWAQASPQIRTLDQSTELLIISQRTQLGLDSLLCWTISLKRSYALSAKYV